MTPTKCRIPGVAALTFTPDSFAHLDRLLQRLSTHTVKATFFLEAQARVGDTDQLDVEGAAARLLRAQGHQIGLALRSVSESVRQTNQDGDGHDIYAVMADSCTKDTACRDSLLADPKIRMLELPARSPQTLVDELDDHADDDSEGFIANIDDSDDPTGAGLDMLLEELLARGYKPATVEECVEGGPPPSLEQLHSQPLRVQARALPRLQEQQALSVPPEMVELPESMPDLQALRRLEPANLTTDGTRLTVILLLWVSALISLVLALRIHLRLSRPGDWR